MANSGEVSEPVDDVASVKRIHEPLALEAFHGHLTGKSAPRRTRTEGPAFDFPGSVVVGFEVGDQDIG